MDEKTKLYVFSKKEVALIFLFMFLIAVTSFVFGVKIGKNYSYTQAGFTPEDRVNVELMSGQEEKVNEIVEEVKRDETKIKDKPLLDDLNKELEQHIKTETSGEGRKMEMTPPSEDTGNQMVEPAPGVEIPVEEGGTPTGVSKDKFTGKYTIQLGSHRSIEEAEAFAQGFKVRGYNPIINEVELPNRGVWYRVSLGVFETITDAKDYVKKENSLFQGQDYVFVRFD